MDDAKKLDERRLRLRTEDISIGFYCDNPTTMPSTIVIQTPRIAQGGVSTGAPVGGFEKFEYVCTKNLPGDLIQKIRIALEANAWH